MKNTDMLFALLDLQIGDDKHEGCVRCVTCGHGNISHRGRWVGGQNDHEAELSILHLLAIVNKTEGIGECRNADVYY